MQSTLLSSSNRTRLQDELVASGRQEIFECFAEGAPKGSSNIDDSALRDAAFGALDFGFNRSEASIVNA
jgi:hypothetical protein